jgi:branched-chain amino acid transport system substrate-binding protein
MKNFLIIICLVFSFIAKDSYSQDKSLPEEINEAIELIDSKEYSSAIVQLQSVRDKYPDRHSLIDYLIIKCSDELNRYDNVEIMANDFQKAYPESKYLLDVQTFLVKSLYKQGKYEESFVNSINLLKKITSLSKKIEFKNFIEEAISVKLSPSFLQQYSEKENDKFVLPFVLLLTAKSFYRDGDIGSGEKYANKIITNYITSEEYLQAVNLKLQTTKGSSSDNEVLVGVMFPLTNGNNEKDLFVQQILDGVKYAFHEYNKDRADKIGLVIEDTKNNPDEIKRIIKEFNSDKRIKCVIGPVFSSECAEVVKNIKLTDLVFISPTATDEDLTENNEQFFQANPPFDIRGKALAQYAFYVESRKNFAVLNSIEGYSAIMANSFADEIKKLGGQIVFKETFKNIASDIPASISKLRNFINQIDGIYLPISQSKDAELIISELENLNLKIPIFGTQDWLEAKGLESSTTLTSLIRITSDFFIDYQESRFNEFSKAYSATLNKEPNRYSLYGYDASKHLITVLRAPIQNRYGIRMKLNSGIKTVGFKNNITFSSRKRNTYLNILKYSDGKFSLIERFKAND